LSRLEQQHLSQDGEGVPVELQGPWSVDAVGAGGGTHAQVRQQHSLQSWAQHGASQQVVAVLGQRVRELRIQ